MYIRDMFVISVISGCGDQVLKRQDCLITALSRADASARNIKL